MGFGLNETLTCSNCGYRAVFGGGVESKDGTINKCKDCQRLFNDNGYIFTKEPYSKTYKDNAPGHCPQCNGTSVERWSTPYSCPRCSSEMKREKWIGRCGFRHVNKNRFH